jgi:PBP1b-binding outer membrane lipoprotein LpoB
MNNARSIKLIFALTIVSLFASACGSAASDSNSPSAVTKRFVESMRQKDVKTFKSLLSKKSIATVEKDAKEVGISTDEMLAKTLEQDLVPSGPNALETRNEKISGDTATVEFKQGNGKWSQNELVREDGNWKVTLE